VTPLVWFRGLSVRTRWLSALAVVLVAVLVGAVGLRPSSELRHFASRVERGDVRDVVDLTGTVNAVTTVQVGSQVSGTIARLYADFNSRVRRGALIAVIDSSLLQGAMVQAEADLQGAQANLAAAQANLERANATVVQTKAEYDRTDTLAQRGLETQQALELARANDQAARAAVGAAVAGIAQARAQISQKEAAVSVARTNLDHTVIRSPIDGVVVARNVDVGQTVAASLQAPTLFTIAQDLTKMQLYAKTDESDVGRFRVGQSVTFKVDAFPHDAFRGVVSQIRMNPTMVQNVVTYDAIVDFANPDLKLFPGMTAYVTIPVASVQNALKVPNSALRYHPPISPEEIQALYARHGIAEGGAAASAADADTTPAPARSGPGAGRPGRGEGRGAVRAPRPETAVVWKLRSDNALEPVLIALGITDHAFTEVTTVVTGTLQVGDQVVTRSVRSGPAGPAGPQAGR
jgi:HlyD family secretion protein